MDRIIGSSIEFNILNFFSDILYYCKNIIYTVGNYTTTTTTTTLLLLEARSRSTCTCTYYVMRTLNEQCIHENYKKDAATSSATLIPVSNAECVHAPASVFVASPAKNKRLLIGLASTFG